MKKKHLQVLREIQDSIPQELILNITKKEKQFHTLKQVVEHALTLPDDQIPAKEKRKFRSLLDSGYLEKEVEVTDTTVEQQISEYLDKEIQKAQKQGKLPKKAPIIRHKSLINKGKQYARRKNARLKSLFSAGNGKADSGDEHKVESECDALNDNGKVLPASGSTPEGCN
jgi:hypothetical protein